MADSTIFNLTEETTLHDNDVSVSVDTSDTTQSPQGTTKKYKFSTLYTYLLGKFNSVYFPLGGSLSGYSIIGGTMSATAVSNPTTTGTDSGVETLSNKTLTSPVINTGVSGTAISTSGTLIENSDTILASQKAVKTYADRAC